MLINKKTRFRKVCFMAVNIMSLFSATGCGDTLRMEAQIAEDGKEDQILQQKNEEKAEKIIGIFYNLYEKATEENKSDSLEWIRSIVNQLGENGYAAVDSKNQIDMTEIVQVMQFCERVNAKEEAEQTIIEVNYLGGFIKYDLYTKNGNVDVIRSYYEYENGSMKKLVSSSYTAKDWKYTKDGYILFSGSWVSEELYLLTLSETEEHTAFRVQPLNSKCRELNRQYLLPISYERNNMFLVDWSEDDFGKLDFYDLYDIFYSKTNIQLVPNAKENNLDVGEVDRRSKEDFENIIMRYINIDSETLQSKTVYDPENATYEYKPRGYYEAEYPEYPYSEVISYKESKDGTISLMVNVVFPYAGISKVYAHEVVVRPLEEGRVQYVSNRIIPSKDNYEETWYTPRLTKEKWDEIYGEDE